MREARFERLFWELYPLLLAHARGRLDHSAAEDVVGETLATLWRKDLPDPQTDEDDLRLRSLAFAILTGHIRNEHRSRRRRGNLWDRLVARPEATDVAQGPAETHEAHRSAAAALSALSDADREVLLLVAAGFSVDDIAVMIQRSPAAVMRRRSRARSALSRLLDVEWNEVDHDSTH